MRNFEVSVENGVMTIRVKVQDGPKLSKSGQTYRVASTSGSKPTRAWHKIDLGDGKVLEREIYLNMNAYVFVEEKS